MSNNDATQTVLEALTRRIANLEQEVADLKSRIEDPEKDWRRTVGMFSGDEVMKRIDAAGQAIRQKERDAAKRKKPARRNVKS